MTKPPPPPLEGPRIRLEPFDERFISAAYLSWLKDDDTTRWLVKAGPDVGLDEVRSFCRGLMASDDDYFFAIVRRDDGRHVGNVRVGRIDWQGRTSRFGVMIGDAAARGIGLGAEVMALVERLCFDTLKLDSLRFPVVAANAAAMAMYRKCGYAEDGPFTEETFTKDGHTWPLVAVIKRKPQ